MAAGGRANGKLDFYQMHTYAFNGQWGPDAPFKVLQPSSIYSVLLILIQFTCTLNQVSSSSYGLNKPLVIGEFASVCAQNEGIQNLFQYAYNNGYQVIINNRIGPKYIRGVILIQFILCVGCLVLAI